MILRRLFAVLALAVLASPLLAQEEIEAPVPIPRPESLGGSAVEEPAAPPPPPVPLTTDPQPVTLSARTTDNGPFIPEGVVWRVFGTEVDETGELAMLARSDEATATFSLPPGDYVLNVAYGRAQATDTLRVNVGPNTKEMILEVGGLELNAAITGDVPIPSELLSFDVFADGPNGRTTIAEDLAAGEMVHVNAGIYSVVSEFGPINAVVRADIRVEPGEITQATLYHRAAQVNLKLVSEEGGEAIADVEWTIKTTSGDTIFSEIGAFPSTVLAEGNYLVLAKLGDNVYNREFQVIPGAPREIEILTAVY